MTSMQVRRYIILKCHGELPNIIDKIIKACPALLNHSIKGITVIIKMFKSI